MAHRGSKFSFFNRYALATKLPVLAAASLIGGLSGSALGASDSIAPPKTPQELHHALAVAFNTRDLDKILALYENDATLIPQPGSTAVGRAQIKEALKGFLAVPGNMQVDTVYAVQTGDVALTRSSWAIRDGATVKIQASGTEIMKRQTDGTWRFAVDHPFGGDAPAK